MLNFFYRSVAKSEMNLLAIKNRIDIYLKKGNERNVLAKRNIIASFGIKIIGIIISLILVRLLPGLVILILALLMDLETVLRKQWL